MARYNPNASMLDDGAIPNNPTLSSNLTPEQLQVATRKLSAGQPLTPEEQAAIGSISNTASTGYNWTEGRVELDQLAAEARTAAAAANAAVAEAKTAAEKAAADKLKAEADVKAKAAANAKAGVPVTTGNAGATGLKTAAQIAAETKAAEDKGTRQSAYDLLYSQFKLYGLESLVTPLKDLITSGASPSEFTIKLRDSDAYKKRFSANQARIQKGLAAISEAEYLGLEDQYQSILRNAGLPESYWKQTVDPITGVTTQEGFSNFIANDVSAIELEDRVMTAQDRLLSASPEIMGQLKGYYNINDGDILAYVLDPNNGLKQIKRKVQAAEIGAGAVQAGLSATKTRAEELAAAGVTKDKAQQGFGTIAGGLQRGSQLAAIYGQDPYTQTTAEQEVFGLTGQTEAAKQRKKLTGLETATFGGQSGASSSALVRDRAGAY